jgi:hypothetical protein
MNAMTKAQLERKREADLWRQIREELKGGSTIDEALETTDATSDECAALRARYEKTR